MTERHEYYFIKGLEMLPKPYHLTAVGLPNIYLLNGVTFEDDPEYGALVTIRNLNGLHRAIGLRIVEKAESMSGEEMRFLRKQLGMTQVALARKMRVSDQTIANYEKENTSIPGRADLVLRLSYLLPLMPDEAKATFVKSVIDDLIDDAPARLPEITRRRIVQGWEERPLAA